MQAGLAKSSAKSTANLLSELVLSRTRSSMAGSGRLTKCANSATDRYLYARQYQYKPQGIHGMSLVFICKSTWKASRHRCLTRDTNNAAASSVSKVIVQEGDPPLYPACCWKAQSTTHYSTCTREAPHCTPFTWQSSNCPNHTKLVAVRRVTTVSTLCYHGDRHTVHTTLLTSGKKFAHTVFSFSEKFCKSVKK